MRELAPPEIGGVNFTISHFFSLTLNPSFVSPCQGRKRSELKEKSGLTKAEFP